MNISAEEKNTADSVKNVEIKKDAQFMTGVGDIHNNSQDTFIY